MRLRLVAALALVGCAASPDGLITPRSPEAALGAARQTLTEQGYALEATPSRPLRTPWRCLTHRGARQGGIDWPASFGRPAAGPLPFTSVGPASSDAVPAGHCPVIFRVEVDAIGTRAGSTVQVDQAWYRAQRTTCAPDGNPLLGQVRCQWKYVGARPEGDATRPIRLALRNL